MSAIEKETLPACDYCGEGIKGAKREVNDMQYHPMCLEANRLLQGQIDKRARGIKITPPPWRIDGNQIVELEMNPDRRSYRAGRVIARCDWQVNHHEMTCNLTVMRAAPHMLGTLRLLQHAHSSEAALAGGAECNCQMCDMINHAIGYAEGDIS